MVLIGLAIYFLLPLLDRLLVLALNRKVISGSGFTTQAECEQNQGDWGPTGIYPQPICRIPTTDSGKPCFSGWQCQAGACVSQYKFKKQFFVTDGKCPKYTNIFGCYQELHFGVPKNAICRD